MKRHLLKTMVALLAIAAAAIAPAWGQNANPDVTLDFTTNDWGIPSGKANKAYDANSYTSGDYTITLQGGGGSSNGYYFNSGYLMLGKSGAYLELPEFESAVDSIVVVGNSAASAQVNQNIYVGGTAVSTQTTGATGTNTYVINENYRAAGNIYTLKVDNAYNTQITYVKVYFVSSGGGSTPEPEPAPAVPHTVRMAAGTEEAANWTLASGNASVPGTQVLENVMSGSTLTATYVGDLKIKEVIATKHQEPTPLTIEALTAGTVVVGDPHSGMQYTLNGGTKTAMTESPTEITVAVGDKVAFYGNGTSITSYDGTVIGGGTAEVKAYGNIMSLVNETGFDTATTLTADGAFYYLFQGYANLKDISGLKLPATTLTMRCYESMFSNCSGLTTVPTDLLPATTLAERCYRRMFAGCENLTNVPTLPATMLAMRCYDMMFFGCAGLTTVPTNLLPATTLDISCYSSMFYYCSNLTTAPVLPATTLVDACYSRMFSSCYNLSSVTCLATSGINQNSSTDDWLSGAGDVVQGTKTFNAVSTAEWPEGVNGIPSGWTRQSIDN